MLKLAGVDFKDTRLSSDSDLWNEKKGHFETIALGQLPILKLNEEIYCHEDAIEEYCVIKAGLVPKCPEDAMRVRMIIGNSSWFDSLK